VELVMSGQLLIKWHYNNDDYDDGGGGGQFHGKLQ
jgi:hypothetical protein